jgi:N-acetylneuraminic acid mutarotase
LHKFSLYFRANVSFTEHPLKDELILFGGEFFDGRATILFNDLYIYDIKKQHWKRVQTPQPPPPRSSHQVRNRSKFLFIIFKF